MIKGLISPISSYTNKLFELIENNFTTNPNEILSEIGRKESWKEGAFYQIAQSVIRAIRLCNPIKNLPTTSYEKWKTMILRFNPIEMMGG